MPRGARFLALFYTYLTVSGFCVQHRPFVGRVPALDRFYSALVSFKGSNSDTRVARLMAFDRPYGQDFFCPFQASTGDVLRSEGVEKEDSEEVSEDGEDAPDDTRDADGNLSRKYTGGRTSDKLGMKIDRSSLRKHLGVAMILSPNQGGGGKQPKISKDRSNHFFLKLKHRITEEEDRPYVGVQGLAHRVERALHALGGRELPKNPADLPQWLRTFAVMAGRYKRPYWSMLASDVSKEAKVISRVPPTFRVQFFRENLDIDYDLRSNRWWEHHERAAASDVFAEKDLVNKLKLEKQCAAETGGGYTSSGGDPEDYAWRPWLQIPYFEYVNYAVIALLGVKCLLGVGLSYDRHAGKSRSRGGGSGTKFKSSAGAGAAGGSRASRETATPGKPKFKK